MEMPQEAFDQLEQALAQARFTFEHENRESGRSNTSYPSHTHSLALSPESSSHSIPVSPLSNDEYDSFEVTITPPPDRHRELSRQNSGLPPTPPTTTHSDVATSKVTSSSNSGPLFADRVRNALESQRSGYSTPVVESHSPPTPDPSPRAVLPALTVTGPLLSHQASAQSHTESFQTATEGGSVQHSTSRLGLSSDNNEEQEEEQSFLTTPRATQANIARPRAGVEALRLSDLSENEIVRTKTYQLESDTDGEWARTKNYPTESESEKEENENTVDMSGEGDNAADGSPISPISRNALNHRAAYQRLWKPIQPGDDIKRPDAALLYGSLPPKKLPNSADIANSQPRIEAESDSWRNSEEIVPTKTPELLKTASSRPDSDPEPALEIDSPPTPEAPREASPKLQESAPSGAPPDPTPPTTAQNDSLEENNIVYRIIREENAKRHSGMSDGSVPAVVIPVLDLKRKLRHTPKRVSLRGDASVEANSKRSSSESGHKLRHKRAIVGAAEHQSAATSSPGHVRATPRKIGAARAEPPLPTLAAQPRSVSLSHRPKTAPSDINANKTPLHSEEAKISARISRITPDDDGLDIWASMAEEEPAGQKTDARLSNINADNPFGVPKLRRSLRERRLDRYSSMTGSSEARPLSMDGLVLQQEPTSPKLRRSSQEKRLERNEEEIRQSCSREGVDRSQSINTKLDLAAEDLTREGREMRVSVPVKERPVSSDRSFYSATSPRRKSFDPRHFHSAGTPYSVSQFSDRTEAELLEARGIQIFPHNNDSLLIVQHASQAMSGLTKANESTPRGTKLRTQTNFSDPPTFEAYVQKPIDARDEIGKPQHAVDSPLTNPRMAPEPPVIKFIPPTPHKELEDPPETAGDGANEPQKGMQRRLSLTQRMKRYGESLVQPLPFGRNGSVRKPQQSKRVTTQPEARPTYLSSFWQPRDFWEEYDSDEDSDGPFYDEDDYEPLPPGGDTSNVEATEEKRRTFLPRAMSKRMPGFRGQGGFLQGNSLGLDRHGTNNRRHYVVTKRASEEMMRQLARNKRRRVFTIPFSRGTRVEYVGFAGLGARMREMRNRRRAKALEKRREKLRGQIGTRVYHDGRCGVE